MGMSPERIALARMPDDTKIGEFIELLAKAEACWEARHWLEEYYPSDATALDAWKSCKNGAWMLWLLARINHPRWQELEDVFESFEMDDPERPEACDDDEMMHSAFCWLTRKWVPNPFGK